MKRFFHSAIFNDFNEGDILSNIEKTAYSLSNVV